MDTKILVETGVCDISHSPDPACWHSPCGLLDMQRYKNLSGNSGIRAYELIGDLIDVEFIGGAVYRYDYANTGRQKVETMKALANAGEGLAAFISQHVGEHYAAKLH